MWLFFAFLSAALLGFYDVFKKRSLRDNAVIPVLLLNTGICSAFFLPLMVASAGGFLPSASRYFIPLGDLSSHTYIVVKSLIVLSSWLCGYLAMKHLPLTIVGPVNATRPVMTLVGALLIFGERLNGWQWAGVTLAVVSFFLLSRSGKKEGIRFFRNRWIYFLLAAALLGSLSGLYDKYLMASVSEGGAGLNRMFVQSWYNLYQLLMMAGVYLAFRKSVRRQSFEWRWSILFISVFLTLADLSYFYALSLPGVMIALVSMVRRSSVLVSFLFGALVFREKNLREKAVDLLLVLLGMVCLYVGTLT